MSAGRRSVGLFTYSTLPRGSVVHAAALADALVDLGWDATLYALDKDGRGFFRPLRARLRLVPAAPAPATTSELVRLRARELADFLARHSPDHEVLHAQDCLSANGLLAARARGAGAPLVRTVHHVERFDDPHLAACQQRSIREATLCLSVSRATRADVAAAFGVDAAVVGNGVDLRRFAGVDAAVVARWRTRHGGGGPVVLAVGGVEPRKNTTRILLAFAKLRARQPDMRLWILGGATVLDHGAYRATFDEALAGLDAGTRGAVVELGVVPDADVPAILRAADVLATPSVHEGFGLVALEGLAAGVPVVAAARAPFTEFLDDACAVLVDPGSPDAIAAGLDRALAEAPRLARAGRERARAHGWAAIAVRHARHYERIASHARDALSRSLA
ncbi:MAG TPA: MSMEG_0565 family glycosyltransferase [Polyangia bacterium]|nr:MSMEG_0565 family glycosyltransferase [Polyangia bacterium]